MYIYILHVYIVTKIQSCFGQILSLMKLASYNNVIHGNTSVFLPNTYLYFTPLTRYIRTGKIIYIFFVLHVSILHLFLFENTILG